MIVRNSLSCSTCQTVTTVRIGIGHGDRQVHSFPCRGCGVPITCVMLLDQKTVDYSLERPINAEWLDSAAGEGAIITFHPEILGPRSAFETDSVSPFVATVGEFDKISEFQNHEAIRALVRERHWPTIKRAAVHFERRAWARFNDAVLEVLSEGPKRAYRSRVEAMSECFAYSGHWFALDLYAVSKLAARRFAMAFVAHESELKNFAEEYRRSKRLDPLWRQLLALHDECLRTYPSWMPVLQLRYWSSPPRDLSDLVVSDKRFDELKSVYLHAFEILARLSVIAIAVESLNSNGSTDLPTKKGSMSIWDFEALDSANKPPHLKKYLGTKHLATLLDTRLRNGIGHNAAHYDPRTDEVVCVRSRGERTEEWRLSYTQFCFEMLNILSHVTFSESYFFDLLGLSRGLSRHRA